jgi:hypothetical protein
VNPRARPARSQLLYRLRCRGSPTGQGELHIPVHVRIPAGSPERRIRLGMMNRQCDKLNPIRGITTAHLNYSPYNQSLSTITLVFLFHHSLSRLTFSISVVFSSCAIRILRVICRYLPSLFISYIFICISFCRVCLRPINHLRICSMNSHLGFLPKCHCISAIASLLLFLITTINGHVP